MKKRLLIIVFVLVGMTKMNAQEKGDIELGFDMGVNLSVVSDGNGNATDLKVGFNAGGSGEYYFSDRWGIKSKLIYDQKGWSDGFILNTDTNNSVTTDFKLNYLTIPVMANWHFGSTRKWYLNFGPYVGFLLNAEDSELGMDLKNSFKSTDFGLSYGIGYKFPINDNTKLYVEYDEQLGLTDVFEVNEGTSAKNSRSSFNLGVLFSLK